jgi:hypothetical protein
MALAMVVAAESRPSFEAAAQGLSGVDLEWIVYDGEHEIRERVRRHLATSHLDGIVLGPMPYDRCRDLLPETVTVGVVRVGPADLAITFARSVAQGRSLSPVSVDTFSVDVVHEVARALDIPVDQIECLPYSSETPVETIVEFHRAWRRCHPASWAISGRSEVVRRLGAEMPVLTRLTAPSTLRAALREAVLRIQSKQAGDQSFGAGVFRILPGPAADLDRARIALRHLLLNTPEFADAWIEDRGEAAVVAFAHRALLEKVTHRWELVPFVDAARADLGLVVAAGFGLGPSARTSVRYAEQAVARAALEGGGCGYVMGEGGMIVGPMGRGSRLAFTYREHSDLLEALARGTGLSPMTLSRLAAVDQKLEGRSISPSELAASLGITDPSGRRLMRTLTAHDLAVEAGTAQSSRRGRPAHLFRLKIAADGPARQLVPVPPS